MRKLWFRSRSTYTSLLASILWNVLTGGIFIDWCRFHCVFSLVCNSFIDCAPRRNAAFGVFQQTYQIKIVGIHWVVLVSSEFFLSSETCWSYFNINNDYVCDLDSYLDLNLRKIGESFRRN